MCKIVKYYEINTSHWVTDATHSVSSYLWTPDPLSSGIPVHHHEVWEHLKFGDILQQCPSVGFMKVFV